MDEPFEEAVAMRSTWWIVGGCGLMAGGFWACGGDDASADASAGSGGATAAQAATATVVGPTSSATGGGATKLGESCSADADCGADLRCITAKTDSPVLGGGAVNGYCTKDCSVDKDCPGEGSTCVVPNNADKGECYLGCAIGPELVYLDDALDPSKCHGRDDLRCTELNAGTVCLPVCGKDSQCDGRECSPRSGACVDAKPTGKPMGAICNPNAQTPECAGFCQKFTGDTPAVCSAPCTLGDNDFPNTNDCGGLDAGLCVYRPGGYGPGDFGRCAAACTQHDQCGNPAWWCNGNNFAMNGYCFTAADCSTTADCTNEGLGSEYACVPTKFGGKCLELDPMCLEGGGNETNCPPRFALGSAALPPP